MGYRRVADHHRRQQMLPLADTGSLQRRGGQLHHIRQPQPEDGHRHAAQGIPQGKEPQGAAAALRPGMALPAHPVPTHAEGQRHCAEHVPQGQLSRQLRHGELLRPDEERTALCQPIRQHGRFQASTGRLYRLLQQQTHQTETKNESGTIPNSFLQTN